MFVCRGPRVLPEHLYKRVVDLVVAGDYGSARKILADFLLVPRYEEFTEYLAVADTRQGCGRDLTEFLASCGSGEHECPCGKIRITVVGGGKRLLKTGYRSWLASFFRKLEKWGSMRPRLGGRP